MMRRLWLLAALVACNEQLDKVTEVHDLRVLAIRADPPEVLDGFDPSETTAGTFPVRFSALVQDPRPGAQVSLSWRFCPVQSGDACHDYEELVARGFERIDGFVDFLGDDFLDANIGRAEFDTYHAREESCAAGCTFDVGLHVRQDRLLGNDLPPFTDLHMFHLLTNPVQFIGGGWPSVILNASSSLGGSEEAMKRINVTTSDPGAFGALLAGSGIRFCGPAVEPPCLNLAPRLRNSNPVFARIEMARGELATNEFVEVEPPFYVRTSEPVRIRPVFTEESFEPYQVLAFDINTREVLVEDEHEEISVSWFATTGKLQDQITWPLFTKTLDTVWTAPDTLPEGGTATVWMVARDQRGGTAWESATFAISP
jgi:hypothetical protein